MNDKVKNKMNDLAKKAIKDLGLFIKCKSNETRIMYDYLFDAKEELKKIIDGNL